MGVSPQDAGLASGLVNTSVQVGGAIGLAVLATLATERTGELVAGGTAHAAALNSGFHLAYLIGAGMVLVAIAVAVSVLRSRVPEAAVEPMTDVAAEPVTEMAAEPVEGPHPRAVPLPAEVASGGGCVETGMRVVIGCGGCAGC
jgi:hypothetical protein